MSSQRRRVDHVGPASPPRGGGGPSSKLRMDRQPATARISDPSLPIGKRKEIDNVMKKARGGAGNGGPPPPADYWDKKLLEAEEKEPNRWRHTGYKKMYIEGECSSDDDQQQRHHLRERDQMRERDPHRDRDHRGDPMRSDMRSSGDQPMRTMRHGLDMRPPEHQQHPLQPLPTPFSRQHPSGFARGPSGRHSRSRSPRGPPPSPPPPPSSQYRRRSPVSPPYGHRRRTPPLPPGAQRSSAAGSLLGSSRAPRPRSPRSPPPAHDHHHHHHAAMMMPRRRSPRSPPSPPHPPADHHADMRGRRTPPSPMAGRRTPPRMAGPSSGHPQSRMQHRNGPASASSSILPRSKRPPSPPPPKGARTPSNSSNSSYTDDSCSMCSPKHKRAGRSRSHSHSHRVRPRSPPPLPSSGKPLSASSRSSAAYKSGRPVGPPPVIGSAPSDRRPHSPPAAHGDHPPKRHHHRRARHSDDDDDEPHHRQRNEHSPSKHHAAKRTNGAGSSVRSRLDRHASSPGDDAPRPKSLRPPEPPEPLAGGASASAAAAIAGTSAAAGGKSSSGKSALSKAEKQALKLRARVKIEGEKRPAPSKHQPDSSDSDDSDSSEGSLPAVTATTRLTLSERFGKMAQWSVDRSNMENMNMRITKDSADGVTKVMIEEGLVVPVADEPPRRFSYSPAPAGHFPEELATTAPTGLMSWDDVRVRYDYYKNRGYLRDLDLKDYVKWEEWWYRYQEWLKQERYYEFYERQMHRRRRKKLPIAQRLN